MKVQEAVTFVELDAIPQKHVDDGVPMPEQDDVDDFGEAFGLTYRATEELRFGDKERERDLHRWELNPACAEDYISRTHARN